MRAYSRHAQKRNKQNRSVHANGTIIKITAAVSLALLSRPWLAGVLAVSCVSRVTWRSFMSEALTEGR